MDKITEIIIVSIMTLSLSIIVGWLSWRFISFIDLERTEGTVEEEMMGL